MKIQEIASNPIVTENLVMIIAVLACFLISVLLGKRYNNGAGKPCLIISRILIVVAAVLIILWIF